MKNQEAKLKEVSRRVDASVGEVAESMGVESKEAASASAKPAPVAARPQSAAVNLEKRQKLQPKFDRIKGKVDAAKEKAQEEFKKGLYAEAIAQYKKAAEILEIALEDFSVFKKDIA